MNEAEKHQKHLRINSLERVGIITSRSPENLSL